MTRFLLLDGIRGLAALFVLLRHTLPYWTFGFDRSFLAVDIFFVLSGFVIAHAYDEKLKTRVMGVGAFMTARLIRMYPVYLLSLGLGLALWWGQGAATLPLLAALVFLPWPMANNYFLFPINAPYWSLLFELATNLLYALVRRWLTTKVLVVILVLAALGMVSMAATTGSIDYGWTWGVRSFLGGAFRSVFGVFLGLLLHRYREPWSTAVGRVLSPWMAFVLVGVALAVPSTGVLDPWIDLAFVFVLFPALILAASRYTGGRGQTLAFVLGSASYPLYVVHHQVGLLVQSWSGNLVTAWAPWSGIVFIVVLVALCVALENLIDVPVRLWLKRRLLPGRRP